MKKTGIPKSADFAIIDASKAPKQWQTLDFLFAMSERQANEMAYQIFESKKKRHADAWTNVIKTIDEHLLKADIVPIDLRYLDAQNAVKLIGFVLSLSKEQQNQILFITGKLQ